MGLWAFIVGKRKLTVVTAHVLDPMKGYYEDQWTVGVHVGAEVVGKLAGGSQLYVVVAYENGAPQRIICRKDVWLQAKSQHDAIDAVGAEAMADTLAKFDALRRDGRQHG